MDLEIDEDEGSQGAAEQGQLKMGFLFAIEQEQDDVQQGECDQKTTEEPLIVAVCSDFSQAAVDCTRQRAEDHRESCVRVGSV